MCDALQSKAERMLHGLLSTESVHWGLAFCITFAQSHFGYAKSFHGGFSFMFRQKMIECQKKFSSSIELKVEYPLVGHVMVQGSIDFSRNMTVQIETLLYKNRRENTYCPVTFNSSQLCGVCIFF